MHHFSRRLFEIVVVATMYNTCYRLFLDELAAADNKGPIATFYRLNDICNLWYYILFYLLI